MEKGEPVLLLRLADMKINRKFLTALACVILSACGQFQNLSTEDVTTTQYLRKTVVLDMTILQIQQAIYDYNSNCRRQLPEIRVNPSKPDSGIMVYSMMGLTQANPAVVIKFNQSGKKTNVVGYTYYLSSESVINDTLDTIKNPTVCK